MIIPQTIQITGLNIEVLMAPTLFKDKSMGGYCDYPGLRIIIAGDLPKQQQEVSFLHECTHFILYVMGEEELRNNEKLVDLLAHLQHQAFKGIIWNEEV